MNTQEFDAIKIGNASLLCLEKYLSRPNVRHQSATVNNKSPAYCGQCEHRKAKVVSALNISVWVLGDSIKVNCTAPKSKWPKKCQGNCFLLTWLMICAEKHQVNDIPCSSSPGWPFVVHYPVLFIQRHVWVA